MTARVTAIPGGSEVLETGSVILARPGVRYQIADVDLVAGSLGAVLTVEELLLAPNQPGPGDLTVTLPDGTVLVFVDMIAMAGQGSGLADGDGNLDVAWLEETAEPAAGPDSSGDAEDGGSSEAVQEATISELKNFGNVPRGDIELIDLGPLELDEERTDLLLTLQSPVDLAAASQDLATPNDPVIPTVDAPPFIVPSARVLPCGCAKPTVRWATNIKGDPGADTFELNLADLPTSLFYADVISNFEDGVDKIILNLNGAGPVTLGVAETDARAGTNALDTVIIVQETGQIVAILQDFNTASGGTINESDITIIP